MGKAVKMDNQASDWADQAGRNRKPYAAPEIAFEIEIEPGAVLDLGTGLAARLAEQSRRSAMKRQAGPLRD